MAEPQTLTRSPAYVISIDPGTDASANRVAFSAHVPAGGAALSAAVRWTGAGAAELWYYPASPRTGVFTVSELATRAANPDPAARGAELLRFMAAGEERAIQATGIDSASTAGVWEATIV